MAAWNWNWIVARDSNGTDAILTEASAERTIRGFLSSAQARDRLVEYIARPEGVYWDGSKCSASELRRFNAGIRRNRARQAEGRAMTIPQLEPQCGSWIVVSRDTGRPVLETFCRRTAEAINQQRYEVLTALQWLVRFNRMVKP